MSNRKTYFSAYWVDGKHKYVTGDNKSAALKFVVTVLDYPYLKGITVKRVDNHSLIPGGSNAILLAVYSNRDIQKMGQWRW